MCVCLTVAGVLSARPAGMCSGSRVSFSPVPEIMKGAVQQSEMRRGAGAGRGAIAATVFILVGSHIKNE